MSVKRKTWMGQEDLLRGYLEQGMTLRQAAEAIGATYSATKAKARRLRIQSEDGMGQSRSTEAASASEWVLAGYEAENDLGPSDGLQSDLSAKGNLVGIDPPEPIAADPPITIKRVRPARRRVKPEVDLTPHALVFEHTEPIAANSTVEEELARGRCGDGLLPPYRDPVDAAAEVVVKRRKSRRPLVIETKPRVWDFPAPGGCLFPHGDVGAPGFGFCAEPVAVVGAAYCRTHIQQVRQRGNKVEVGDG